MYIVTVEDFWSTT